MLARQYYILFLLFFCNAARAQRSFEVIVPAKAVMGEPFQVQYVVEDSKEFQDVLAPVFSGFKLVSGPRVYKGKKQVRGSELPLINYTYTLVPLQAGRITLQPATAVYHRYKIKGAAKTIDIVPPSIVQKQGGAGTVLNEKDNSPEESFKSNLFLRVQVNRKQCYVGEPVVATFKLYSRVEAESEVIKNPGFYGFSVSDMIDLNEQTQAVELVQNRYFHTSILRQVQLYPIQEGTLTIDEMHVQNVLTQVDSSNGYKEVKTEWVAESQPVQIVVKALPKQNRPAHFNEAIGAFTLSAQLEKDTLLLNESGKLEITLSGRGNFMQLYQPQVSWPNSIEHFDPVVKARLAKYIVPVSGTKTYSYFFVADSAGTFTIPPVVFSYFDPYTRRYQITKTDTLTFIVKKQVRVLSAPASTTTKSFPLMYVIFGALSVAVLITIFWLLKSRQAVVPAAEPVQLDTVRNYSEEIERINLDKVTTAQLCLELQGIIYAYFQPRLGVDEVSFGAIRNELKQKGASAELAGNLESIWSRCEQILYSQLDDKEAKVILKEKALQVLQQLEQLYSAYL